MCVEHGLSSDLAYYPNLVRVASSKFVMDTRLILTKRLHLSGLTPSITQADLISRLSSFGAVKDLDVFGKLDALGQPRKFGYVTLEGTKAQLAKCEHLTQFQSCIYLIYVITGTNVLSGSTWKGAKLETQSLITKRGPSVHLVFCLCIYLKVP